MAAKDPTIRRQVAQLGAFALHAGYDPKATTKPARARFLRRFEDQVDPDRVLSETERARRAQFALKLHMGRLALASAQARRRRKTPEGPP